MCGVTEWVTRSPIELSGDSWKISPAGISILSPWLAMMITVPRRLTCVGLGSHLLCISILIIGIIRHGIGIPPNAFYKYFVFIFQKNQLSIVLAAIDCLVSHWPDICPNSLAKTSHWIKIKICSLHFGRRSHPRTQSGGPTQSSLGSSQICEKKILFSCKLIIIIMRGWFGHCWFQCVSLTLIRLGGWDQTCSVGR